MTSWDLSNPLEDQTEPVQPAESEPVDHGEYYSLWQAGLQSGARQGASQTRSRAKMPWQRGIRRSNGT